MMRKTLRASVFVLALCCPAFAGDIPCPTVAPASQPVAEEPTAGVEVQSPQTADGVIQNGVAVALWEVVLSLLALS
jgi:hypothetical protein